MKKQWVCRVSKYDVSIRLMKGGKTPEFYRYR
jgi:hypothetical protein